MHLMLCLSTLSTLVFALHQYQISLVSTVSTIRKAFHPVFEMFYSNLYRQCRHKPLLCSQKWKAFHSVFEMFYSNLYLYPDSDGRLFIRYSKCSTQICIDSVNISPFFALRDGRLFIRYLKCSTQICICIRIQMEGFSSGIRNVLLKSVSTVST